MPGKKRQKILIETKIQIIEMKLTTNKSDDCIADEFQIDRSTETKRNI